MSLVLEKKILNEKTRHLVGEDGGPSNDAHEKAYLEQITKYRDLATSEYIQAVYAHMFHKNRIAREHIDKALKAICEAFWRAEGTEHEESQHEMLHRIASWNHDNLGCYLVKSGEDYIQKCSIAITHKRFGFSMGFTGTSICSLCHKDEFECEHSRDRTYWIVGGVDKDGKCIVCDQQNCKLHDANHIYRVCPSVTIVNPVLHEVSMVKKPAVPTARMTEVPVSRKELEAKVGVIDESIGMVYKCDLCKQGCPGFAEIDFG